MLSNRVIRNIWLILAILSVGAIADRTIGMIDGSKEWWQVVSSIIITAVCIKCFISYRNEVRKGNLFGRVNVFKKS